MHNQDGRTIQKQKGITMNDSAFQIRRPRKKNILRIAAFSAGEIAAAVLFHFFYLPAPETQNKKLFAAVLFCAFLIFSLFATAFIADGFRNLFGKAAVIITAAELWISGFPKKIPLHAIEAMEIINRKKEFLILSFGGQTAEIPDGLCELPLFTVREAIRNRIDDLPENQQKNSA